jgi:hypothetical protein
MESVHPAGVFPHKYKTFCFKFAKQFFYPFWRNFAWRRSVLPPSTVEPPDGKAYVPFQYSPS